MPGLDGNALPETVTAYYALVQYLKTKGITARVADFGGVRTEADTNKILRYRQDDYNAAVKAGAIKPDTTLQHFRPISPYGSSFHNYGAAFDLLVVARPAGMAESQALAIAGAYAPSLGLRWGGNFRPNADWPHFELAIPLSEARARYAHMTGGTQSTNAAPSFSMDLSNLLPGLTPSGATNDDALPPPEVADLSGLTDDSGEADFYTEDGVADGVTMDAFMSPQGEYLALGLLLAGVVAWAIRRKFF